MLIGNAGRDAELRYIASGTAQAQFSLAVSRNYRGNDNEWREETEWFQIVAWANLAERISQQVTKGKQVYVEGRLQTRTWDDDQGQKHYRTEVIAQNIFLLGRRDPADQGGGGGWNDDSGAGGGFGNRDRDRGSATRGGGFQSAGDEMDADDLPFE
jgi:single-strand DNA-binding protein